jgi:hypothetical protein
VVLPSVEGLYSATVPGVDEHVLTCRPGVNESSGLGSGRHVGSECMDSLPTHCHIGNDQLGIGDTAAACRVDDGHGWQMDPWKIQYSTVLDHPILGCNGSSNII